MKPYTKFSTALLLVAGALAMAPSAVDAADGTQSALTTQTQQMDALSVNRGESLVSSRISSDFSSFAGSANSDALVTGLRSGSSITMTSTDAKGVTTSTSFTPPTGKMGYGNVYISMSLAKQQLAAAGITEPTAQQLEAALMGGTVTSSSGQTTTMTGVLQLRADGMGWGQIAQHYGYKLGPVVSGMKSSNAAMTASAKVPAPVTTAAGASSSAQPGGSKSGIVTGAGATGGSHGQGQGNAYGRGIVTGAGTGVGPGAGQGNAYGRGIVTGGGDAAGHAAARSGGQGKALGKGN
ncbi:MAG: hypothetical protein ACT4PS_06510 [Betaproteobacteria bacterium]